MGYIIVANYNKDKNMCLCLGITDDGQFNVAQNYGVLNLDTLGNFVITNKLTPLNFSVDRNGNVVQDNGSFSRFEGSVVGIVIAEIISKTGKRLGYRVVSSSRPIAANLKIEEIIKRNDELKKVNKTFLQNAIIRDNAVACYPQKPFKTMMLSTKGTVKERKKLESDIKYSVERICKGTEQPIGMNLMTDKELNTYVIDLCLACNRANNQSKTLNSVYIENTLSWLISNKALNQAVNSVIRFQDGLVDYAKEVYFEQVNNPKFAKWFAENKLYINDKINLADRQERAMAKATHFNPADYNSDSLKEIAACKSKGIDPSFLYNPNLASKQMRVLWVAKSKGVLVDYFAKPEYNEDVMKFYADVLYNKDVADECKEMLKHPELSVDQLKELYLCACEGIDYSDMIGLTPDQIRVAKLSKADSIWGNEETALTPAQVKQIDYDLFDKAMKVALRKQGYSSI